MDHRSRALLSRLGRALSAGIAGLILISATGACAARTSQFGNFATAGDAYVKAADVVLDEAGTAAIRADTAIMVGARPNLPADQRGKRLLAANTALKTRAAILRDLRRHGRVLQRYFETLAAVANSDAPEAAAAAAQETFGAIAGLSSALKASPLKPVVPAVTKLIVGSFKVRILEDELRARADAVAAELALQEALFKVIGDQLKTDLQVQLNVLERDKVVAPFAGDEALPKDWGQTREQVIKSQAASESLDAAARAAAALRGAFTAVVANRFDRAAFDSLLDDIGEVLAIIESIQAAAAEESR